MKKSVWCAALVLLLATGCQHQELPVLPVGGDFALTDFNNQHFELSSLRGKAVLVFFGYTSCPDVCPTTLSKLSSVYKRLGSDSQRVQTLYITVDPGRDTPTVLKEDLSSFPAVNALGLTGTKPEIDTVVGLYGASYEIIPLPDSAAKYSVAHSTTLYGVDAKGRTRVLFPYEASVDDILNGVKTILGSKS